MNELTIGMKCYAFSPKDIETINQCVDHRYNNIYYNNEMLSVEYRPVEIVNVHNDNTVQVKFDNGNRWYMHSTLLYDEKHKPIRTSPKIHCVKCGNVKYKIGATKLKNGKYICMDCLESRSYYTNVTEVKNKQVKKGLRYGFEFECKPKNDKAYAEMSSMFVPTEDGSLADGYVEFKTPMYQSLIGVRPMFKKVHALSSTRSCTCGSHINISHVDYDYSVAQVVRQYSHAIFDRLMNHMRADRTNTERVCGRYFVDYASFRVGYCVHRSFINLSHDDRIEFRISKFKNENQYFELVNLWGEVVTAIMKWYKKQEHNDKTVRVLSEKVLKIYMKYENGNAKCQKQYHK